MVSTPLIAAAAFVTAAFVVPVSSANAEADAESLVNALNAVFGKHDGMRAAHTNGICVKGSFKPTPDAASLSKAPHFSGSGPFPVTGRFSMGGGDPAAPNTQKDNVRGLALHFDIGKGNMTDLVMISAPIFAAEDPDQFLALLTAVATKDKDKIGALLQSQSGIDGAGNLAQCAPSSRELRHRELLGSSHLHVNERQWPKARREIQGASPSVARLGCPTTRPKPRRRIFMLPNSRTGWPKVPPSLP